MFLLVSLLWGLTRAQTPGKPRQWDIQISACTPNKHGTARKWGQMASGIFSAVCVGVGKTSSHCSSPVIPLWETSLSNTLQIILPERLCRWDGKIVGKCWQTWFISHDVQCLEKKAETGKHNQTAGEDNKGKKLVKQLDRVVGGRFATVILAVNLWSSKMHFLSPDFVILASKWCINNVVCERERDREKCYYLI